MKQILSKVVIVAFIASMISLPFSSCVGTNQKDAKNEVINGGDKVTRKDGHEYVILYNNTGAIATVFHAGDCTKCTATGK